MVIINVIREIRYTDNLSNFLLSFVVEMMKNWHISLLNTNVIREIVTLIIEVLANGL